MNLKNIVILSLIFSGVYFLNTVHAENTEMKTPDVESSEGNQVGEEISNNSVEESSSENAGSATSDAENHDDGNTNESENGKQENTNVDESVGNEPDGSKQDDAATNEEENSGENKREKKEEEKEEVYDVTVIRGVKESPERGVSKEKSDIHASEGEG